MDRSSSSAPMPGRDEIDENDEIRKGLEMDIEHFTKTGELPKEKRVLETNEPFTYWDWFNSRETDETERDDPTPPWTDRYSEEEREVLDALKGFDFRTILTKTEAEVIKSIVLDGKSLRQISEEMDLPKSSIVTIRDRAGKKIKKMLLKE